MLLTRLLLGPKMRSSVLVSLFVVCAACTLLAGGSPVRDEDHPEAADAVAFSPGSESLTPDTFRKLAQVLYQRGDREENRMQRKFFYNENITCNDGSPAGYYIRRNLNSKRWIVYLEGGWICHDARSCAKRSKFDQDRTSSKRWPRVRMTRGILSADAAENPHLADANHVFVPYCSSDSWSGTRAIGKGSQNAFLGSFIVREVVRELADFEQLLAAKELFLTGSSAGGTGVLINVDMVAEMLAPAGINVRGVVDSGWFIDNSAFANGGSSVLRDLQEGMQLWHAKVPTACALEYTGEEWKCFLGYRLSPYIRTPLFIFQWQFDSFQLYAENIVVPATREQWNNIHQIGHNVRGTLSNLSAVFSPACIAHEALTDRLWIDVKVNDVSLPDALDCWASSLPDTAEDMVTATKNSFGMDLESQNQMDESYLARKDNKILLSSDLYSPRSSSDSTQSSFKFGSNHVRSIGSQRDKDEDLFGSNEDGFHNSISSQLERRRPPQQLKDNRTHRDNSAKKGNGNGHNGHHSGRSHHKRPRKRRQHHNGHTSKGRHQCQTNSNSCDEDEDAWMEADGAPTNGDLIRSLDQRQTSRGRGDHVNKRKVGRRNETRRSRLQRERRLRRRRERRLRKLRQRNQRMLSKRRKEGSGNKTRSDDYEVSLSPGADQAEAAPGREQRQSHSLRERSAESGLASAPAASCAAYLRQLPSSPRPASPSSPSPPPPASKKPFGIHLVDTCSWPHCNRSCPKLKNPETGLEIDFPALWRSFGVDMTDAARAMGVDVSTLNSMNSDHLLHLMTPQGQN